MSFRLPSIDSWILVLVLPLFAGGCEQPTTQSGPSTTPVERATLPSTGAVPDSLLDDSLTAALNRFEKSRSPSSTDSLALRHWADAVQFGGDSLRSLNVKQAREALKPALQAYRTLGDSTRSADVLGTLGKMHEHQSQYEEALRRYENALRISRTVGTPAQIATHLVGIGDVRRQQGRYENALERYDEALRLYREQNAHSDVARTLNEIGRLHERRGRYASALDSYERALEIYRDQENRRGIAQALASLGNIRQIQGRYEEAKTRLREALSISREQDDQHVVARTLNDIGIVHYRQGEYAQALNRFEKALSIYRDLDDQRHMADALNRVGAAYSIQGRYGEALTRYQTALSINRARGNDDGVARNLNNIGIVHRHQGRYEEAQTNFREALSIQRKLGDRRDQAINLSNLGEILRLQGRPEEALRRYRAALSINRELGAQESIASNQNNIGKVYESQGQYEKALRQYHEALSLRRELGSHRQATSLHLIGDVLLDRGHVQAATDTLNRAVRLAEERRLNVASPDARRSLLSTQIDAYRDLTTAHIRARRADAALRSLERARARLLADHLAGTAHSDTTFAVPQSAELRRAPEPDEAALLYANVTSQRPLAVLVATRDTTYARRLPDTTLRTSIGRKYSSQLRRLRRTEGPLTAALERGNSSSEDQTTTLAETIRLYRSYLTQQDHDSSFQRDLARRHHALLVEPMEKILREKETLTVVPTGALGYLPFEALRTSDGNYLIEEKQVRYTQSLTVLRQLQKRTYAAPERPLLAIGGAAYGAPSPGTEGRPLLAEARSDSVVRNADQASALYRSAERRMERGQSPHSAYAQLGYDQWSSLYGSELEVQKLKQATGTGTTLLSGLNASEERVRQMSESGELATYQYLHFATHGIAVPEAPALSALVLSQVGSSDSLAAQDGYLTMREIANLQMQADVSVLSACRTGLGRIIAGEGVVNLSHAFLRAGSNATLVSQWRVLDWSTQQFMTATYRKAQTGDRSFAEATAQVKRSFIAGTFGERNTDPLRWAPFVYYGRE